MTNLIVFWFALFTAVPCNIADKSVSSDIITRSAWGAKTQNIEQTVYSEIPSSVVIYHSGTPSCYSTNACMETVRSLQDYHMNEKNWGDIRANFLVCENGEVYQGRGWRNASVNSNGFLSKSIEICIIGNLTDKNPEYVTLYATNKLLTRGVLMGFLSSTYSLYIQRHMSKSTSSPDKLYESMISWGHIIPSPVIIARSLWDKEYKSPTSIVKKVPSTILLSHIAMSSCKTINACTFTFHMAKILDRRKWSLMNPTYTNFFISEDGNVYEDAGWSSSDMYNGDSIEINLIGKFADPQVITVALDAIKNLLELGVAMGALDPAYSLYEHNHKSFKFMLPENIRNLVKEWPHWREKPSIIERSEWNGEPIPIEYLDTRLTSSSIFTYELASPNCTSLNTCKVIIKNIQMYHKSRGKTSDIPYNFLIDLNGNIYEGTGWSGITTRYFLLHPKILNICIIGNFEDHLRTYIVNNALDALIKYGKAIATIDREWTSHGEQETKINSGQIDLDGSLIGLPRWRGKSKFVMRSEWDASDACDSMHPRVLASAVVIFNSVNKICNGSEDCDHQMYELSNNSFNFVIGQDGNVYKGRGWNSERSCSDPYPKNILEICVIGNYENEVPSIKVINGIQDLLKYGVQKGKLAPTYAIYEHRHQSYNLTKELKKVIRTLPHYRKLPKIMSRLSWNARMPNGMIDSFQELPSVVFISQYAAPRCFTSEACKSAVKHIQMVHMENYHWSDIGYNFLIGNDNYVYTGRGWNSKSAQWNIYQNRCLNIGLIGDFHDNQPDQSMLMNLKRLLNFGVYMKLLHPSYILYNADLSISNFRSSQKIYDSLKTWPNLRTIPNFIARSEWNAENRKKGIAAILKIPSTVVLSSIGSKSCYTITECARMVKIIQLIHMNKKHMKDIQYNFVIGRDGNVYEGHGWKPISQDSVLHIAIIGTFNVTPNSADFVIVQNLLAFGVSTGYLNPSYMLKYNFGIGNITETAGSYIKDRSVRQVRETTQGQINFTKIPNSVVIYHSATDTCNTTRNCNDLVRRLEIHDIIWNKADGIRYNFLIDESGQVYDGRGWSLKAIDLDGYNSTSIHICIIGTFDYYEPNTAIQNALKDLIKSGISYGKLISNYTLYVNRFAPSISLPANQLQKVFKSWPNWREIGKLIPRSNWSCIATKEQRTNFSEIPSSVIIFNLQTNNCIRECDCTKIIKDLEIKTNGIGYNYIIGEDGNIYEGRGWDASNIEILLLGNFTENKPLANMIESVGRLLENLTTNEKLQPNFTLYEYRFMNNANNDDDNLHKLINIWPFAEAGPIIYARTTWISREVEPTKNQFTEIPNSIVVTHTNTLGCLVIKSCITAIRDLYMIDLIRMYPEEKSENVANTIRNQIYCHFLIGGDGNVYEGLGWDARGGEFLDFGTKTLTICMIGNFSNEAPNYLAIDALERLLKIGVAMGKINNMYNLYKNYMITETGVEATKLNELLKQLPYWKDSVNIVGKWSLVNYDYVSKSNYSAPPVGVIISYIDRPSCTTIKQCANVFNNIQGYILSSNFLIGDDGNAFEGTGWSYNYNNVSTSMRITLYGNFTGEQRISVAIETLKRLLEFGVTMEKLDANYILYEEAYQGSMLESMPMQRMTMKDSAHWRAIPTIIPRWEWNGGRVGAVVIDVLRLASRIVIYQLVDKTCTSFDTCKISIKLLQESYAETEDGDVPYHFLINEKGNVYEGYGWLDIAHARNQYNENILKICIIGKFQDRKSFPTILYAIQNLLDYGIAIGKIKMNYILYGLRHPNQVSHSVDMYESIKHLPHWKAHPNIIMQNNRDENELMNLERSSDYSSLVIIAHSSTPNCTTMEGCLTDDQNSQIFVCNPTSSYNKFNFFIDDNGNVYEGLGWNVKGKLSIIYKASFIEICIMGNYEYKVPSSNMINAIRNLIEYGVSMYKIRPTFTLYTFRPSSPNVQINLASVLETLPHWKAMPNYSKRSMWGANEPNTPGNKFSRVPHVVVVSHTATSGCDTANNCRSLVRLIQDHHMNQMNWPDIAYNFLIGEDGTVYVGRGWQFESLFPSKYHERSIEISLIGNFTKNAPDIFIIEALKNLLNFAVFTNELNPAYIIYEPEEERGISWQAPKLHDSLIALPHWQERPSIINRSEWGAMAADSIWIERNFSMQPSVVIIGQMGTTDCDTIDKCKAIVQNMQKHQMMINGRAYTDSHFYIGADGNAYEDRGWDIQGYRFPNYDNKSIVIRVIGSYYDSEPKPIVFEVIKKLLAYGVASGALKYSYVLHTEADVSDVYWSNLHGYAQNLAHWQSVDD